MNSELMGNLVLAIGGGVGGALVFAVAAAIGGRNAGIGLLAGGIALGAVGLPVGWNVVNHAGAYIAAAASSDPTLKASEDDLPRVLKRYYPDDYAKLRGSVFSFNRSQARNIAIELLRREAPKADDDSMMGVIRLARDEAKQARDSSSEQCASSLARLPAQEQQTVLQSGGRSFTTMSNVDAKTQVAYCDMVIAMLDNLSDGSPHDSAALMRGMISRAGDYRP
jgi:hypothetical protein